MKLAAVKLPHKVHQRNLLPRFPPKSLIACQGKCLPYNFPHFPVSALFAASVKSIFVRLETSKFNAIRVPGRIFLHAIFVPNGERH